MTSTPLGNPLASPAALAESALAESALVDSVAEADLARGGLRVVARTGWFTPAALAFAAMALGLALHVNFGQYHPAAMPWLTLALLACCAAAALPNFGRVAVLKWRPDQLVLAVALAVQFALLYAHNPGATLRLDADDDLMPFKAGVALAAALAAVGVSGTRTARVAVPMLLLTHLALGVWVIRAAPMPRVDVQVFQRDAAAALLDGRNPYAMTFPDVYHGRLPALYGPGLAADGRLNFGYPYPPLSLLLALPGHLLGDFRYAHLLALTAAGGLIAYARPGGKEGETRRHGDKETRGRPAAEAGSSGDARPVALALPRRRVARGPLVPLSPRPPVSSSSASPVTARSVAAAALLLFTPRGFFVIEAGWTEPFAILMLAATVFVAGRKGMRWAALLPVTLGLLIACKQYLVLAAPLALLLPAALPASLPGVRRLAGRRAALAVLAVGVAAAVSLPMALWDVDAFVHSAVTLQFRQPFRPDALSYLASFAASRGGDVAGITEIAGPGGVARGALPPAWTCFAAAGAAGLLALWRCPRTPAGFATGVALVFFAFFATGKQAFCNYYAFVLAALCCALAATPGFPRPKPRRP